MRLGRSVEDALLRAAAELFRAWDKSQTEERLAERIDDLRSLIAIRQQQTSIRALADVAGVGLGRGDDLAYRRFRDRMLQRHRRRRMELLAVLASPRCVQIVGASRTELLEFVAKKRR